MVYISGGSISDKRSVWSIKYFTDMFWALINVIVVFFSSLFVDPMSKPKKNNFSAGTRYGPGQSLGSGGSGNAPSATSNQARLPAELKHINKRRKRKQLRFPQ
eukprot:TRINITY_DN2243_c0_g1_i1.p1 TRINITY_DN2243_c0_g1~~TRINITY_DN2243_c0_g1_i1.p1  ORF type:complete len:103 (-),score=12.11 TRINITY_DN2243_c0_g1_i1:19-327(-)